MTQKSNWGGRRPGAGKKEIFKSWVPVNIPGDVYSVIQAESIRKGSSRAELVREKLMAVTFTQQVDDLIESLLPESNGMYFQEVKRLVVVRAYRNDASRVQANISFDREFEMSDFGFMLRKEIVALAERVKIPVSWDELDWYLKQKKKAGD